MKKYLLIGAGGFVGAVLRYTVKGLNGGLFAVTLPVPTLLVNTVGAFLLAFILTAEMQSLRISKELKLGLSVGLMGALTTFSTLCKELAGFLLVGDVINAGVYVALSLALGLLAAALGVKLALGLLSHGSSRVKNKNNVQAETDWEVD